MRDRYITIFFGIISFIITATFFKGAYTFSLDLIPKLNDFNFIRLFYGKIIPVYGGGLPLSAISSIIPTSLFQKFFIFLIIFLAGYSMYHVVPLKSAYAKLFAGLLYMLNPYTYIRIVVGHWGILFAYAVLPLAVKSFTALLEEKSKKNVVKFVFFTTLIGFNAHTLVISFIIYFVVFCFKFYESKDITMVKGIGLSALLFLLLNSYWLIPLATAGDTLLTHISTEDLAAFAPRIESFSALFTLASMHGFWRAGYVYAKDFLPFWQVLFVFILFLAVHGFVSYYRDDKLGAYAKSFALIWLLGLILAAGIRSPFSDFFKFLFDHVPLIKGMRDTHKFVTMLALSYAYLGALGLAEIEKSLKDERKRKAIIFLALIVPFVYSFAFFNGFAGQIKPGDYPKDWYEVNEFLNNYSEDFKVLFFPWHLYMDFHWVKNRDKRIANPAPHFFDKEVISGKNIEIGNIYRQVYTPEQLYIDFLLKNRKNITNFGELVSIINVKYILLTKEADYKKYFFLFNQSDLELVKETKNFYVFKNKHYRAKIFSTQTIACVNSWDELLKVSKRDDITKRLYLIGNCSKRGEESYKAVEYEKINPAKYKINAKHLKYVVFTEEYSKDWKLGKQKPLKAYGVVNAFSEADASEIKYERFYKICLPSYVISLVTFLACMGFLFYEKKALI